MPSDELRLKELLQHLDALLLAVTGRTGSNLNADQVIQNAVQYHLVFIGEAASHVSRELQEKYAQVPWKEISRLRGTLAHHDDPADLALIWRTACNRLTMLRWEIGAMLESEFPKHSARG